MSSSEVETSSNGTKRKGKMKFAVLALTEIKQLGKDEIFAYIERLHHAFKKNEKKLKKYKDKFKKTLKQNNDQKSPQKAAADCGTGSKVNSSSEPGECSTVKEAPGQAEEINATAAFQFVDEMRQAAQHAQNLNEFVYEPTSGLYYDHNTGYYYNADYGLYYDGNTSCYYSYNNESKSYEFHSQVEAEPNQNAQKEIGADGSGSAIDDAVEFDEWGGVITDMQTLRNIKAEKLKLLQAKERNRQKKKLSKAKTTTASPPPPPASSNELKKRKRATRHCSPKSDSLSGAEESGSDADKPRKRKAAYKRYDIEDGELSSSSSGSSECDASGCDVETDNEIERDVAEFTGSSRFQDIAKKYPPSLRIIVQDTNLDGLKVGSLSLITFKGGSLGREGTHDVIIPDVNVSKFHLRFDYDHKKAVYTCIDLGSRNGTILNGARLSGAKRESEAHDVVHGSTLQIAQTKLLCHVHEGNSTCGLCEPGLLMSEKARDAQPTAACAPVALTHKEQLKKLQKKYGLENEKFVVDAKQSGGGGYNDRAATRRIQVGSSTDNEKTQTASVNTEISSENKGFQMLSKLGWNKGETLGKHSASAGLLEPINVASNAGKKGLGCDESSATAAPMTVADKKKIETWRKTQARYQKADIFCDSDDEEPK